jgi:hypothetical protein
MVLSPSQEFLFKHGNVGWTSFSQVHKRDQLPSFSNIGCVTAKPLDLHRATIYIHRNKFICTGYASILPDLFVKANYFLHHYGFILAEAIKQGDAIAASDGSFQDQYGSAAWVLEGACLKDVQ